MQFAHDLDCLVGGLDEAVQLGVELGVAVPPPRDGAHLLHIVVDSQHSALRLLGQRGTGSVKNTHKNKNCNS